MGTRRHVNRGSPRAALFEAAAAALAGPGWFAATGVADSDLTEALADEARSLWAAGAFRPAGVGRGASRHVEPTVRGDHHYWFDPREPTPPQRRFLDLMEEFRVRLNRALFLSLHEIELQYAVYPPGQRYARHVDQHEGGRARLVTVLLYLNRDWKPDDGGCLRIYSDEDATEPTAEILPDWGTFVCFRSDRIPHEVLAPRRQRLSLGGWYRVRSEIPLAGAAPRLV